MERLFAIADAPVFAATALASGLIRALYVQAGDTRRAHGAIEAGLLVNSGVI